MLKKIIDDSKCKVLQAPEFIPPSPSATITFLSSSHCYNQSALTRCPNIQQPELISLAISLSTFTCTLDLLALYFLDCSLCY